MSNVNPKSGNTWESVGEYYGYPKCCIDYFVKTIQIGQLRDEVSEHTGFLPCLDHAKMIKDGTIRLQDLILPTRQCPHQFPIDDMDASGGEKLINRKKKIYKHLMN